MSNKVELKAKSGAESGGEIGLPSGEGKAPALVLIQEWWGITDHIRSLVDRFAAAGFLVVAPDLYHGKTTKDPAEAGELMQKLDGKRALDDIGGAIAFAKSHARSTGKVGITGFCMGGAYTLAAASALSAELGAAVAFYGLPPEGAIDPTKVKTPVLAHVATHDDWVKPEAMNAIKDAVNKNGGSMKVEVYEAHHAFMNDTRPEVHDPDQAKLAWDRTVKFLHQHLG
jgi:carboxymethylenebutenolidase